MRLMRPVLALTLVASLVGCLDNPGPTTPKTQPTGNFVLTIDEFASGPTSGAAQFSLERLDNQTTVSVSLTDALGFAMVLEGTGGLALNEEREIGDAEGMFGGTISRRNGSAIERYALTSGTLFVRGRSPTVIVGDIVFTATQVEGPALGTVVGGRGNFRATGGNVQM